ncbi:MAG: rRNA adenine N-6-methyltransferase family protein [Patescibacteria group bacterium]|jgi:phospholipid N-methyltransferase
MNFFKQFLSSPLETGAIKSSSKNLSKLITNQSDLSKKKCIVELGSGKGVFTKEILNKISPKCIFFCLEINPQFVIETKKNCPKAIVYNTSAKNIKKYLLKHKQISCDCIISGLPWSSFNKKVQETLLDEIYTSLEDNGEFLTFAYLQGLLLPNGIRFQKLLKNKFKRVKKTKIIWKNLPPALVYYCKK